MVEKLCDLGEISYKNIFIDGTKIEADANRYTFVWAKAVEKNLQKLKNKIKSTRIITKENNLLINLILELENKTTLKDKQIAEVLEIGKNRIG